MDNVLFFDTETTGTGSFDRVVQLAWSFRGAYHDHIIRPDGYAIPDAVVKIHGISTEMALAKGEPAKDVLAEFMRDVAESEIICAHNIAFDKTKLLYEMSLLGEEGVPMMQALGQKPCIDTMAMSRTFVGARASNGRIKNPTLTELHMRLFSTGFDAHNALSDVQALERCFSGLMEQNVIVL